MGNRQQQIEQRLESILDEREGLLGMALVSRDGIPVLSRFTRQFDQKAFSILVESAMVATLTGAAEEAMDELEGGPVRRVSVETDELRMVVVGANADLLLVAMSEDSMPVSELNELLDTALTTVADLV